MPRISCGNAPAGNRLTPCTAPPRTQEQKVFHPQTFHSAPISLNMMDFLIAATPFVSRNFYCVLKEIFAASLTVPASLQTLQPKRRKRPVGEPAAIGHGVMEVQTVPGPLLPSSGYRIGTGSKPSATGPLRAGHQAVWHGGQPCRACLLVLSCESGAILPGTAAAGDGAAVSFLPVPEYYHTAICLVPFRVRRIKFRRRNSLRAALGERPFSCSPVAGASEQVEGGYHPVGLRSLASDSVTFHRCTGVYHSTRDNSGPRRRG